MSFTRTRYEFHDKDADYEQLASELTGLLADERDLVANAANTSALLFDALPGINWAGFYFVRGKSTDGELVVGPFQGKPACVRIAMGKGVCGTAAANRTTIVVPDVHAFPGHIACDAASRSEIVIPLVYWKNGLWPFFGHRLRYRPQKARLLRPARRGVLIGVLDIDSPDLARFDEADRRGLERLARIFVEHSQLEA
jgi:GAF domain-containing protein